MSLEAANLVLTHNLGTPPKLGASPDDVTKMAALRAMSNATAGLERVVRQRFMDRPHAEAEIIDEP